MKFFIVLATLAVFVVLLDRFHDKLPTPFPQLHRAWTTFSHVLGTGVNYALLSIVWVLVFGPYALVYKCSHKKEEIDPSAKTYWKNAEKEQNLRHQF